MDAIVEAEGECYNAAPTFATFTFRDDVNLDLAEYQIDSDGWNYDLHRLRWHGVVACRSTVDAAWLCRSLGRAHTQSTSVSKMMRGTGTVRVHRSRLPTAGSS